MDIALMIMGTGVILGIVQVVCFVVGAKIGQMMSKGKDIEMPHPIEAMRERKEKREAHKEARMEQDKLNTILDNIDSYDGTGIGQKDVPRG
jgi:hypothetical protein